MFVTFSALAAGDTFVSNDRTWEKLDVAELFADEPDLKNPPNARSSINGVAHFRYFDDCCLVRQNSVGHTERTVIPFPRRRVGTRART